MINMVFPELTTTTINLGPPLSHLTVFNGYFSQGLLDLRHNHDDSIRIVVLNDPRIPWTLDDFWMHNVVRYKTDIIEDGKFLKWYRRKFDLDSDRDETPQKEWIEGYNKWQTKKERCPHN